jgi:hypothetical protein
MEVLRILKVKQMSPFYALVGLALFYYAFGTRLFLTFFTTNAIYFGISKTKSKKLLWITTVSLIGGYSFVRRHYGPTMFSVLDLDHDSAGTFGVSFFWMLLKCTSFADDKIDAKSDEKYYSFVDLLGYSFYFPTILLGPVIIYDKFRNMLLAPNTLDFHHRAMEFLRGILQIAVFVVIHELAQHFFYVNILSANARVLYAMNPWPFYGLGYLLGQFFNLKYMTTYGFAITFGKFDEIDMPRKPICISRVHLYSDMWKRFDEGLYQFLFR